MKKIGQYTARGEVTEVETEAGNPSKVTLFDGSFKTGYRVTSFYVWSSSISSSSNPDVTGKLATSPDCSTASTEFLQAADSREIAWAAVRGSTDTAFDAAPGTIIDPDNFIVEDLYVYGRTAGSGIKMNYLITMDKYEISEWQGALCMARDKQND